MQGKSEPATRAPISGFVGGVFIGAFIMMTGGILSAFFLPLGIIVVIVGLGFPFVGLGNRKGKCPNCGKELLIMGMNSATKCPDCAHQIVLRDDRFVDMT